MKNLVLAILVLLTLAACDGSPSCHPPDNLSPFCTGTDGGNLPYHETSPPK
jgi:hypothetical protein